MAFQDSGKFSAFSSSKFSLDFDDYVKVTGIEANLSNVNSYIMLGAFETLDVNPAGLGRFRNTIGLPLIPGYNSLDYPMVQVTIGVVSADGVTPAPGDNPGDIHIFIGGIEVNITATADMIYSPLVPPNPLLITTVFCVNANNIPPGAVTKADGVVVQHIVRSFDNALAEAKILIAVSSMSDININNIKARIAQKKLVIDPAQLLDYCRSFTSRSDHFNNLLLAAPLAKADSFLVYRLSAVSTPLLMKMVYESRGMKTYWDTLFPPAMLTKNGGMANADSISDYIVYLNEGKHDPRFCDVVPIRMKAHIQGFIIAFSISMNDYYQGKKALLALDPQEAEDIDSFYKGIKNGDKGTMKASKMRHTMERHAYLVWTSDPSADTKLAFDNIKKACDTLEEDGIDVTEEEILKRLGNLVAAQARLEIARASYGWKALLFYATVGGVLILSIVFRTIFISGTSNN